jgi:hypothetical protein
MAGVSGHGSVSYILNFRILFFTTESHGVCTEYARSNQVME